VHTVAKRFLARANEARAVLNSTKIDVVSSADILGEHYNLATQTRALTSKTRTKVSIVQKYLDEKVRQGPDQAGMIDLHISRRELAAIVGVLLFGSRVVSIPLCEHYWPLRTWRELMAVTHWDEWASQLPPIPANTAKQFVSWASAVQHAKPVPITAEASAPGLVLFVDASATGWGVVAVRDGGTLCDGQRWSDSIGSSVVAEPLATWMAICRTVNANDKHITIFSDHLPLVYAGNKGYAKCFTYNTLLQKITATFPEKIFRFEHIAGVNNPSDEPSRGRKIDEKKLQEALRHLNSNVLQVKNDKNGEDGPEWEATALNPLKNLSTHQMG